MKKFYEQPEIEVVIAVAEDIILVSGSKGDNCVNDPFDDFED